MFQDAIQERGKIKVTHFIWKLCFLENYSAESILAANASTTPKKFRKHVWNMIQLIGNQHTKLVSVTII